MRKLSIITFLLFVLFTFPAQAQEKVWLPMLRNTNCFDTDNAWRLIKPAGSTNEVLNPSAEIAGNFAAQGGATATRETTFQKYGLYSYRVQTAADNDGISFTLDTLANVNHYVTMRVRGLLPGTWDWSLDNAAYLQPMIIEKIDNDWNLYGFLFPAAQANGSTTLYVRQNGGGSGDFYLDGVQVEAMSTTLTTWTTFIDGTQEGCGWNGTAHTSTSTRSAESRAGGISQDFFEEYNFQIRRIAGAGTADRRLGIDEYALLPGGELNNIKIQSRRFTIIGKFITDSEVELHQKRQALETELLETSYIENQPFRIRFNGAEVQKEIAGHYAGGLEGKLAAFYGNIENISDDEQMRRTLFTEEASIQFEAPNPFWQEVGESAALLDANDSATFRYVAGRLKSTGQWDDLGLTNNPTANGSVFVIARGPDNKIYCGGQFTDMNNVAGRDNIARYDESTDTWETVGAPTDINAQINDLVFDSSGTLLAVGVFTNAGGDANADYVAQYDIATNTWSALAAGGVGNAFSIDIGEDGTIYIGGNFVNWNAIANADGIVQWTSAGGYAALSTGIAGGIATVQTIKVSKVTGNVFIGGGFITAGGIAVNNVAEWDPSISTFSALSSGTGGASQTVFDIEEDNDGTIIIAGEFTIAGGVSINRIASWNGTAFSPLGDGGSNNGYRTIKFAPDGNLWCIGSIPTSGDLADAQLIAIWNSSSWEYTDILFDATTQLQGLEFTPSVIVNTIYSVFVGSNTSAAETFGGSAIVANDGNERAFPKLIINRSGGTSARFRTLRNERSGKVLIFDYSLLDGEELIVDLTPTRKSIISSSFGSRLNAILSSSDFGDWTLLAGNNNITSFANTAGGPTIIGYLLWRDNYNGYD